ncbi:MAG: hypothetical protein Q8P84_09295 [Deltaproteobacteria bacterium]|nr:hypothetical protein [Deltaproteobacteria bacterium]MDZ4224307.1 hypothetical protein [bacterium]
MKKILAILAVAVFAFSTTVAAKKKLKHPFDLFTPEVHEMHNSFFEGANVSCDNCHKDPDNFADRSKMNKMGCHTCHNNPDPPAPASQDCARCHADGFPKPQSHKAGWIAKHQDYAKQNVAECSQCHRNNFFCINCHQRRDSIQQIMHRRNFLMYHSVEARANPRKCDECHTVAYCQRCHAGKGP